MMTYTDDFETVRDALTGDATLTSTVSASNIVPYNKRTDVDYPAIAILMRPELSRASMCYNTLSAGSKQRKNEGVFQIDIYSNRSARQASVISDRIEKILHGSVGDLKITGKTEGPPYYDDEKNVYQRIHRWSYFVYVND